VKFMLKLGVLCVVTSLPLGWSGCASTGGEGSETHFVACKKDSDCVEAKAGDRCVERRCTTAHVLGTGGAPPDGGQGGEPSTGGAGTGGAGTGGAPGPGACDVPLPGTPPSNYAVSFHFENRSNANIAILEECFRHFEIFGCTDGYAAPLPYSADYAGLPGDSCKRECPDTSCGCIGTCQLKLTPVTNDTPVEETWDGSLREPITSSGCGCVDTRTPAPGRYRVRVPVFPAGGNSADGPSYHVDVDFELGAEASVDVVVPLDQAPEPFRCAGLDSDGCEAAGVRCMAVSGRSASSPTDAAYAGCKTNRPDLPGTAFTCARSAPGEECWLFKDTYIPDGWETLICSALPDDCGVAGNRHPAL